MGYSPENKKRHVVSFENMSEELTNVFNEKYPRGFSDYLPDLVQYTKPDGTPFYAVTIETDDSIYLVKIKVKTDDADDLERWLDSEAGVNDEDTGEGDEGADTTLPDDNISQYGNMDDDSQDV